MFLANEGYTTNDVVDKLQNFFLGDVLKWVLIGVSILFVFLAIKMGVAWAKAESAEQKQAAKGKAIALAVGAVICFSASWVMPAITQTIADLWTN